MPDFVKSKNLIEQRELRRELRKHGTPAEGTLWRILKNRQVNGLLWRRQFSIGPYILDFYCPKIHLCIELDGADHFSVEGSHSDLEREEWLWSEHHIRTIRFENKEIFEDTEQIKEYLSSITCQILDELERKQ